VEFVGIFVKYSSFMVDSWTISFCRFFFGIVFLGILLYWRDRKLTLHWTSGWIWFGAIGKACNYIFENIAITIGYAYGNILVQPLQTILLLTVSILYFKEKVRGLHWVAAALCLVGVGLVSWNGLPLREVFGTNILITFFFVLAAIGASAHVLSQKMLIKHLKSGEMNFSTFALASAITFLPLPVAAESTGDFQWIAVLSLVLLGLITGISFLITATALKTVPLSAASIIMNMSVLFTLLWAWIFFREPITLYILAGACLFIVGMLVLNLAGRADKPLKVKEG
jgi:drug/metabolite transporter (DMT)-like permease